MSDAWLGHRDLCPVQYGGACDCPCPSCGVDLNTPPPASCPQPAHQNVWRRPREVPQDLPKCGNAYPAMSGQRARTCLLLVGHKGAHRNNGDAWRELTAEEAGES